MTTYQHVIPGMQEDAAATFAQLIDAACSEIKQGGGIGGSGR